MTELPAKDRCLVMGVVNVTPDSFSDGGQWYGADAAIAHGLEDRKSTRLNSSHI